MLETSHATAKLGQCGLGAATWLKNTGWELLGDIPIIGSLVKGLRQTFEETKVQMEAMYEGIQSDLENQFANVFPRLEYDPPSLPEIEYTHKDYNEK